jgi:hypothetical protein
MDAHSQATDDPAVAALHAVQEHGPPDQIANAYAPELAAAWARRTGLLALALIPALAIVWNVALRVGPPPPWHHFNPGLQIAEILIATGVGLTLICSTAALLGTGRLIALAGERPLAVRCAITAASVGANAAVLSLLTVVAARAITAPSSLDWPAVLTALTLTLIALTNVGHNTYQCLTSTTPGGDPLRFHRRTRNGD